MQLQRKSPNPVFDFGQLLYDLLIVFSSFVSIDGLGIQYRCYKGISLQTPCSFVADNVRSPTHCAVLCAQHGTCKAASYHTVHQKCCGAAAAFDENAVYVEDDDTWLIQEKQENVWYAGWALAFRAAGASGKSFYRAWNNNSHYDDNPVRTTGLLQWGCLTMNGSLPCTAHFRSVYLDTWASLGVKKVSLRLYKNGVRVVNVVFNGTGSGMMSWMTPPRVLQSPWNDLSTNHSYYNTFGIEGFAVHKRHFFINREYGGCPGDKGWLCAGDILEGTRNPCPWEDLPHPVFLYSTASGVTIWQGTNASVGTADVLAVFIQF